MCCYAEAQESTFAQACYDLSLPEGTNTAAWSEPMWQMPVAEMDQCSCPLTLLFGTRDSLYGLPCPAEKALQNSRQRLARGAFAAKNERMYSTELPGRMVNLRAELMVCTCMKVDNFLSLQWQNKFANICCSTCSYTGAYTHRHWCGILAQRIRRGRCQHHFAVKCAQIKATSAVVKAHSGNLKL